MSDRYGPRTFGRSTLPDFNRALNDAHEDDEKPQPLCQGREDEYVMYAAKDTPGEAEAEEMCIDCPLYLLCRDNARRVKPGWGVWGGIAWIDGRHAHRLPEDDPRWVED